MTACVTGRRRWASAVSFIFCRTNAEIWDGEYCLPSAVTQASPLRRADDLVGNEAHVLLGHGIFEGAADQALDREEGPFRIGYALPLGGLSDQTLAVVGERDNRGRGARAFRILNDLGGRAIHDGDARVGRAQVNADHFRHHIPLLLRGTVRPRSGQTERRIPPAAMAVCAPLPIPNARRQILRIRRVSSRRPSVSAYIGGALSRRKARKRRIIRARGVGRRQQQTPSTFSAALVQSRG